MAFVSSTAIFGGVAWYLSQTREPADTPLVWPLAVLAVALAGGSLKLPRSVAPQLLTWYILRWAMAESVGLFGVVLAQLGEPIGTWAAFNVAALTLMLLAGPREEDGAAG